MRFRTCFAKAVICAALFQSASGSVIELTAGRHVGAPYNDPTARGIYGYFINDSGRGIGFVANQNLYLDTVGMDFWVRGPWEYGEHRFALYESIDGHSVGRLIKNVPIELQPGEGWQDFDFGFKLYAGQAYVLNFSRSDGELVDENIAIQFSWEPSAFHDYGPLAVVEGFDGFNPTSGNVWLPHYRVSLSEPVPDFGIHVGGALVAGVCALSIVRSRCSLFRRRNEGAANSR